MREDGRVQVLVDGSVAFEHPLDGIEERFTGFGNRPTGAVHAFEQNAGVSEWRWVHVRVQNTVDHSVDWSWDAASGRYPDQFRRDRLVILDRHRSRRSTQNDGVTRSFTAGDSGYSGWTQLEDGTIVICDYTPGLDPAPMPFVRAYVVREEDLV